MTSLTHEFSLPMPLPAAPARVFDALTRPEELTRWFCEHAQVDPRVGGELGFWGRHTYDTPHAADATQQILALEPGRLLSFSWRFAGQPSEVTITLAPEGEGTKLTGRHHFAEAPGLPRGRELVEDLWKLHTCNLHAHLGGGEGLLLPDFTDPAPLIRMGLVVDAPRERIWSRLVEPAQLDRWIAVTAAVEPREGGAYTYGWKYQIDGRDVAGGPTRILELVENEKLVTDWPDWRGDAEVPVQQVTWLLEAVDEDQTRVTVIHEGFARAADLSDYPYGWLDFLRKLAATL